MLLEQRGFDCPGGTPTAKGSPLSGSSTLFGCCPLLAPSGAHEGLTPTAYGITLYKIVTSFVLRIAGDSI